MSRGSHDITAHATAVTIGAAMRDGAPEFYTTATPATQLMEAEGGEAESDRSLAVRLVMAYLFGATPHPAMVMQRLYLLTREVDESLLATLPFPELARLISPLREGHEYRVAACLRGTRAARRRAAVHERIISHTLAAAYHRHGGGQGPVRVEIEDLLRHRENELLADYEARLEAMAAGLRFFYYEGPQAERTILRVYALAKASYPALILHMTVRQLGSLFGVTGAAWSERVKQKFNRFLESRGATGVKAAFQKSDAACEAYARAQLGNHNRRSGLRRTA